MILKLKYQLPGSLAEVNYKLSQGRIEFNILSLLLTTNLVVNEVHKIMGYIG